MVSSRSVAVSLCGIVLGVASVQALTSYTSQTSVFGLVLATAFVAVLLYLRKNNDALYSLLFAACVILVAGLLCCLIQDSSVDGRMYHKPAMAALHDGWNPWMFPDVAAWTRFRPEPYYADAIWQDNRHVLWVSHYPNFSWLFGAGLMGLGFGIESGKCLNLLLAIATLLYACDVVKQYRNNWLAARFLPVLIAFPAIVIGQLATAYVDGVTYSAFALVALAIADHDGGAGNSFLAALGLIVMAGLKFTGPLFATPLLLVFALCKRPPVIRVASLVPVALLLLSHPYLNHVYSGLAPHHPLDTINHLPGEAAAEVTATMRPLAFARSVFAETSIGGPRVAPVLKLPGIVSMAEVQAAGFPDPRYGGNGPLASLAIVFLLGASVVAVYQLLCRRVSLDSKARRLAMLVALMFVLPFLHPGLWWARYVPSVALGLALAVLLFVTWPLAVPRTLGIVAALVLAANLLIVLGSAFGFVGWGWHTRNIRTIVSNASPVGAVELRGPKYSAFAATYLFHKTLGITNVRFVYVEQEGSSACSEGAERLGEWIDYTVCGRRQHGPEEWSK